MNTFALIGVYSDEIHYFIVLMSLSSVLLEAVKHDCVLCKNEKGKLLSFEVSILVPLQQT